MDTSPDYILMCEKAQEIQEWATRSGSYTQSLFTDDFGKPYPHLFTDWLDRIWWRKNERDDVFLPRQDQLQEMVSSDANSRRLLISFTDWIEYETQYRRESMEQLWLAFVMTRKFSKIWNGVEWVKVE